MSNAFQRFCDHTSLHGFNFLVFEGHYKIPKNIFWSVVIAAAVICSVYIMKNNIDEFSEATVAYNLESPTVPLDDVFFPSVAFCNMNNLRKSMIHSLMKDPVVSRKTDFVELRNLIDSYYVSGGKDILSYEEQDLIDSKENKLIGKRSIYLNIFCLQPF